MFEDSLLESGKRLQKRNPWATVLSFGIEGVAVGLLVLVPMVYTDAIPVRAMWSTATVFAPPTKAPEPPTGVQQPPHGSDQQTGSNFQDNVLVLPPSVPVHAQQIIDVGPGGSNIGPQDPCVGCIEGLPTGNRSRVIAEVMKPPAIATIKPPTRPIVISHMDEGMLIRRVTPDYPILAKQTRTQGSVVLAATIGKDGMIQNLQAMSGHPLLIRAAIDAVRQWRYRPYVLNGQPVDVETTITVNFNLN